MNIKGTAVKTISEYIQLNHSDLYSKWFDELPTTSKEIFSNPIFATNWYDLIDAIIIPTLTLSKLLNEEPEKIAWQLGRYSSEVALKGVYKIFLKISSPIFVLSRVDNILSTYYNPNIQAKVIEKANTKAAFQIFNFQKSEKLNIYRIGGWVEKTIETCAHKKINVNIEHIENDKEYSAIVTASWD